MICLVLHISLSRVAMASALLAVGISAEFTDPCPPRVPNEEPPKARKLEPRVCRGAARLSPEGNTV